MVAKEKRKINIVTIGHVDSGKSTTCGNLVAKLGDIDPRIIEKYEKEAEAMGKKTFKYAWVLDRQKSERERGITISSTLTKFSTPKSLVTIIDAPGHRDFIKNMISGTSQADAAVLMVSAAGGEFEAGISETGQTREHAMLANALGIRNIILCINKMDNIQTGASPKERFTEITTFMKDFLISIGYKEKNIILVAISGFNGENVFEASTNENWPKTKTLVEAIDSIRPPKRDKDKKLIVPVHGVFRKPGVGIIISGRIESGILKPNTNLVLEPGNKRVTIKSIEMHHESLDEAYPGMNVGINVKGIDHKSIKKGMVLCDPEDENRPKKIKSVIANVINFSGRVLRIGYSPVLINQGASVTSKISEVITLLDRKTLKKIESDNAVSIPKGGAALVKIEPKGDVVLESFKKCGALGRFSMRDSNFTVALGVVLEVEHEK